MPNGLPWPKISVVTINFNYVDYLELTMRSVLLQGYPDLDYIIIDGGSSDGSVDIVRKYERWLGHWISERDRGTSDALNKGCVAARGDVMGFLFSDDVYTLGALEVAGRAFVSNPECQIINGDIRLEREDGTLIEVVRSGEVTFDRLVRYWVPYHTPPTIAVFFRRKIIEEVGLFKETLRYANDYEMWLRIGCRYSFIHVAHIFAIYCIHSSSVTGQGWDKFIPEWSSVSRAYWGKPWRFQFWRFWVERSWNKCLIWFRRLSSWQMGNQRSP